MTLTYMFGYSGSTRTESELQASPMWSRFDPEYRRRLKGLMDASIKQGHMCGPGGGWRSSEQQRLLFLSRYHPEDDANLAGDVFWPYTLPTAMYGKPVGFRVEYWERDSGEAPAAPPGRSYHESTTALGHCLAVDMVGDLSYIKAHAGEFGLLHFGNINGEPWHLQPVEIPHARINYVRALHEPLRPPTGAVPAPPPPKVPFVIVPKPILELRSPVMSGKEVLSLQNILVFWKWMAPVTQNGKPSADGWFGNMTRLGVMSMQRALNDLNIAPDLKVDGVYGPVTAGVYKKFAEIMAAVGGN